MTDPTWLPPALADLIERPLIGVLATIDDHGHPHATAVWIDHDHNGPLVNTLDRRAKHRHMSANPAVALTIVDPNNPYRVLTIQGNANLIDDDHRATKHIDDLAHRYLGLDRYPRHHTNRPRRLWSISPTNTLALTSANDIR